MGPGGFDEICIFLFLTCFSDEGWKPGPGQETNDTQMSQGDQNKHKPVYNDFRNIYIFGLMSSFPFLGTVDSNAFLGTDNFQIQPNTSNNKTTKNNLAMKQVFVLGKI